MRQWCWSGRLTKKSAQRIQNRDYRKPNGAILGQLAKTLRSTFLLLETAWVPSAIILGSAEIRLRSFSIQEVNMYAVIKTGGKQYRVASGEKIKVEQIAADVGQEIVIDQVLAVGNGAELKVGTPLVSGATVKATVVAHGKHDKVHIFKMRRRKHYQKRQGHRQQFTELQIGAISA